MAENETSHNWLPGFVTVWHSKDEGPQQDVTCPKCNKVFGTVGEKGEMELFCKQCQTVYFVKGNPDGEPAIEQKGRRIVIEGSSRLADALHGKRPEGWEFSTGDYIFQIFLLILLFVALAFTLG